jgi:hypothetical protein
MVAQLVAQLVARRTEDRGCTRSCTTAARLRGDELAAWRTKGGTRAEDGFPVDNRPSRTGQVTREAALGPCTAGARHLDSAFARLETQN